MILLADANARVGSVVSEAIGDWQGEETQSGACFHEMLTHWGLWLPSTFEDSHSEPGIYFDSS